MKKEIRIKVYNKFKGCCAYCGGKITYKQMQVDHIFPKKKEHWLKSEKMKEIADVTINDINEIDNLNPSCGKCNRWKKVFTVEGFREEMEQQIKRGIKSSANFRMALKYGLIVETKKPVIFYFEKHDK